MPGGGGHLLLPQRGLQLHNAGLVFTQLGGPQPRLNLERLQGRGAGLACPVWAAAELGFR